MRSETPLNRKDRILIFAPHPDDEVLGCGGIIQKAIKIGIPVHVIFFTYGDNNEWAFFLYRRHPVIRPKAVRAMGLIRYEEAHQAAKILGYPSENLIFLGYPDFRTFSIWNAHWGDTPAASSMFTRVKAVPYKNALRPGAPYKGEEVLGDLKTVLQRYMPTRIFFSHPADYNHDHSALYLFMQVALWELENELKPQTYPYLVHYKRWPLPRGLSGDKSMDPPGEFEKTVEWQNYSLDSIELEHKLEAIKKHKSQYDYSAGYLLSFIRTNELFSDFPPIILSREPVSLLGGVENFIKKTRREMIDTPPEKFVGFENCSVCCEGDKLIIDVKLSRPLGKEVGLAVYLFGYRKDNSFAEMPKLHISFGAIKHRVYDRGHPVSHKIISVNRNPKDITFYVPLEILGSPQRILMNIRTYLGELLLSSAPWRKLMLSSPHIPPE